MVHIKGPEFSNGWYSVGKSGIKEALGHWTRTY